MSSFFIFLCLPAAFSVRCQRNRVATKRCCISSKVSKDIFSTYNFIYISLCEVVSLKAYRQPEKRLAVGEDRLFNKLIRKIIIAIIFPQPSPSFGVVLKCLFVCKSNSIWALPRCFTALFLALALKYLFVHFHHFIAISNSPYF